MIGHPRAHHRRTDSTNSRARELAARGAPHGTLVTAGEQTEGRGRQGRGWTAPPGRALLMSLVIREAAEPPLLPLLAAVAVCDACEATAAVSCRIKWPNDIWVERRKLAGILVEGRPQESWAVLGLGVNVLSSKEELPPELRESAISLAMAAPDAGVDPEGVLQAVLGAHERWLRAPSEQVLAAWRERDALQGERVRWEGHEGLAAGIADSGGLIVDTGAGRVELGAGEVHLLDGPP